MLQLGQAQVDLPLLVPDLTSNRVAAPVTDRKVSKNWKRAIQDGFL